MDILSLLMWFGLLSGIILAIKYWRDFRKNIPAVIPYFVLGVVIMFVLAGTYTLEGISLSQNVRSLIENLAQFTRNAFLATVGLTLCLRNDSIKRLRPWEEGFTFLRDVPIKVLAGVILGYGLYTILWFCTLAPEIFRSKLSGLFPVLSSLSLGGLTALNEELLFRLFLLGLIVALLKRYKYNWLVAVTLSSAIWSYAHWSMVGLGWIKFFHVFPLGIALGFTLKKYGFETCVFLHIAVNVVNIFSAQLM
jgi:membrane protease YdiL (CAAX protease family)